MRFPEEFLNELKSRVRLSDVVGKKVSLKKRGKDWVGLSPFSSEKTPSFYVHDDRGFYKCFSTQKAGDAITFLTETERLTFAEAVEDSRKRPGKVSMGVLAATGLIVGESLFGVAFAGIAGASGDAEVLAVVKENAWAAPLGMAVFAGAVWWLYARTRAAVSSN